MKRFSIFGVGCFAALLLLALPALGRPDGRPVEASQLPAEAQKMLHTYFNNDPVRFALHDFEWDDMGYEVRLASGAEIDFSNSGRWTHVNCAPHAVPEGLIPAPVLQTVKQNHPDRHITKIERDRRGYEVELSGGVELDFNSAGKLVGWDD